MNRLYPLIIAAAVVAGSCSKEETNIENKVIDTTPPCFIHSFVGGYHTREGGLSFLISDTHESCEIKKGEDERCPDCWTVPWKSFNHSAPSSGLGSGKIFRFGSSLEMVANINLEGRDSGANVVKYPIKCSEEGTFTYFGLIQDKAGNLAESPTFKVTCKKKILFNSEELERDRTKPEIDYYSYPAEDLVHMLITVKDKETPLSRVEIYLNGLFQTGGDIVEPERGFGYLDLIYFNQDIDPEQYHIIEIEAEDFAGNVTHFKRDIAPE